MCSTSKTTSLQIVPQTYKFICWGNLILGNVILSEIGHFTNIEKTGREHPEDPFDFFVCENDAYGSIYSQKEKQNMNGNWTS